VPMNHQYAILKSFAQLEDTPGVPGLDLPGLDIAAIARGFGCTAIPAESPDQVAEALHAGLGAARPTVVTVPISTGVPAML
jgi:benzoylformate decarboxylase